MTHRPHHTNRQRTTTRKARSQLFLFALVGEQAPLCDRPKLAVELPELPEPAGQAPTGATLSGEQAPLFDPPPAAAAIAPKPAGSATVAVAHIYEVA